MSSPKVLLNTRDRKTIDIFELLCLWIASVSLTAITLLILSLFNPLYALILGTIFFVLLINIFNFEYEPMNKNYTIGLLLVLAIALLFRVNPYLWVMGGQDQGVYVNMSATYEETGGIFITDSIRESLTAEQKIIYDERNQYNYFKTSTDELGKSHQPGVYINDLQKSEYVFQFYQIHPIWMSIFGQIFGSNNRVYSLVFFSLISILAFYFIALELTRNNRKAAYLIAIFLAVNPLHAFFTKFPVSEIVSLAFSSTAFYFLLKYYKKTLRGHHHFWLLLVSASLFLSLFLNHISGFLYLPLFYLLLIISLLLAENSTLRRHLAVYCGLIFVAYFISFFYGYLFSPIYFWSINAQVLHFHLEKAWTEPLTYLVLTAFSLVPLLLLFKKFIKSFVSKTIPYVKNLLPIIFYVFIIIGIYHGYQLAFTDKWMGNHFVDHVYNLSNKGITSLWATSLMGVIYYLTPVGFILFLIAVNSLRKKMDIRIFFLLSFLITAWLAKLIMKPIIFYQYYYARYLLSEVIPYGLLIISIYIATIYQKDKKSRVIAIISILAILSFSIYFTSFQLTGQGAEGPSEAIEQHIINQVKPHDIIILNSNHLKNTLSTPLTYYYHKNVMEVLHFNRIEWASIFSKYDNIYAISKKELPQKIFTLIDTFNYSEKVMESTQISIPRNFVTQNKLTLFLYRIEKNATKMKNIVNNQIDLSNFEKTNFSSEAGFDWTQGDSILNNVKYILNQKDHYLILHTGGHSPYANELEKLQLKLYINEIELTFIKQDGYDYIFEINKNTATIEKIEIRSNTFVPKDLKINNDTRTLGVDVLSIEIKETI